MELTILMALGWVFVFFSSTHLVWILRKTFVTKNRLGIMLSLLAASLSLVSFLIVCIVVLANTNIPGGQHVQHLLNVATLPIHLMALTLIGINIILLKEQLPK